MRTMTNSRQRRLVLHRQTLRALAPAKLEVVAGGGDPGLPKTNAWTGAMVNLGDIVPC